MPHLTPLFTQQEGVLGYTNSFSAPIVKFWEELEIITAKQIKYSEIISKLVAYNRTDKVTEAGEFSIKGDIVSIWPLGYNKPVKLEYFGDQLEKAYTYDELFGRQISPITTLAISPFKFTERFDAKQICFIAPELISPTLNTVLLFSTYIPDNLRHLNINISAIKISETDYQYPALFFGRQDLLIREIARYTVLNYQIAISTRNPETLPTELNQYLISPTKVRLNYTYETLRSLPAGFTSESKKELLLTDREIFGTIHLVRPAGSESSKTMQVLRQLESDINIGDYIVHEDYGVGIYKGLTQEDDGNQTHDYLLLEYDKEDQLFVPISQVAKLSKYINDSGAPPKLTRLGKKEWENIKSKVKKSIGILARELIEHYARRQLARATVVPTTDSPAYTEFVNRFPYELTQDQHRTTNEILDDLQKTTPMNRLLIGDVGFGKTEVFMRAAFKMYEMGKQVAILCPTTILAAQHYAVFAERFAGTGAKIISLSRFNTAKENQDAVDEINAGNIDIIIGTHRLLSNDVKFHDLGLLVVDEEQKFGVGQKEKVKKLNYAVHLLSVTATPIPRTLSMALSTIQDISIISTPPKSRKSIETKLLKNDWNEVAQAVKHEISRGGQVYFVHNQVQTIQSITARLNNLLPGVTIVFAHGQMPAKQLDQIMTDFYLHKYQVLVATTIIENGLDMPNVNTMIINQAHRFGLAQLYQLRGRVGRSERQAYCYLFYEGRDIAEKPSPLGTTLKIKSTSKQSREDQEAQLTAEQKAKPKAYLERLQAILNSADLGSGFKIASRDLEIRGAGNLLGHEQSGHISTIGYSLYMQMLAQEIEKLNQGIERGGIVSF